MPTDRIIDLIRQGGVSMANIRSELPSVDAAESKVITFEIRAKSLHSAMIGMSTTLRDDLIPRRRNMIAWLNNLTSDRIAQTKAKARGDRSSVENYLRSEVDRVLREFAVNEAAIDGIEAEYARIKGEWAPALRLAEGMRAELNKRQQQQRDAELRSRPLSEKDPAAIAAEMRYQMGGGATDEHIARFPSGPDWLQNVQANAYGASVQPDSST